MGGFADIFGKKNDGASFSTHAAMQKEGVGPYDAPVPAPPPPPPPPDKSQVGDTTRGNTEKLEALLMKNGLTRQQAQEKIRSQGKATGVTYK